MELPSIFRDTADSNGPKHKPIPKYIMWGIGAVVVVTIAIVTYGYSYNRPGLTVAADIPHPTNVPSPMMAPDTPTPPVRKVY